MSVTQYRDTGTYTVVWNSVDGCTITPATDTFTVTTRDTNVVDAPTAVYSCPGRVPPDTTITDQPPDPANSTSASFSFTGSDNLTDPADLTFQCALDGAPFTSCASPQTYSGLSGGSHTFRVRARDEQGNVDHTPATYTWDVETDPEPPETSITSGPTDPTNQTSARLAFSGTDDIAVTGFECALDGAPFAACSSPTAHTGLGEGSHVFQVRARDAAGNVDATPASYTWRIDTTAPVVTVPADLTEEATGPAGAVVTFPISANDHDPVSPAVSCSPASASTFALGTTTVDCSATDAAGNTGTASFDITIQDTTGPTLHDTPTNRTVEATKAAGAEVTYTAPTLHDTPTNRTVEATKAAGAEVTYTAPTATDLVDGTRPVTCTPPSGGTFAVGTTTVECSASDTVGNAASSSFSVTVRDTTAPVLTVPGDLTVDATSPAGAAVAFSVSATDAVTAAPTVTCTASGATTGPVTSGTTFAIGTTSVSCTATDAATNASGARVFTVTVESATSQVTDLLGTVHELSVDPPTRKNYASIVQNAQTAIARGDLAGACDKLGSFISQVQAQSGKKLTEATADGLIADAQRIRTVLGCR